MPRLLSEITSNGEAAFPWKLHRVLDEADHHGFTDIVSWQGNRAFKVHDPKNFEKTIMKKYFNQTRYKSFQRQLNIYGFERITIGVDIGSYTHQLLVRGKPNICRFMVRTKVKNKGSKAPLPSMSYHGNSCSPGSNNRRSTSITIPQHRNIMIGNTSPLHKKMIRSMSCPGTRMNLPGKPFMGRSNHVFNINRRCSSGKTMAGFNDDVFDDTPLDSNRIHTSRLQLSASDIGMVGPSTIEDDFSSGELFNGNNGNMHCDDVKSPTNMTPLPSDNDVKSNRKVCEGGDDRSNHTQVSDLTLEPLSVQTPTLLEARLQQVQEQESIEHLKQQHAKIQQMEQQQRREHECRLLELQIQELQNRVSMMNQHRMPQTMLHNNNMNCSNHSNSNNYLCNGVAAIEACDRRGTVTPTSRDNSRKSVRMQMTQMPDEMVSSLNPTPIFVPMDVSNNTSNSCTMNNSCNDSYSNNSMMQEDEIQRSSYYSNNNSLVNNGSNNFAHQVDA